MEELETIVKNQTSIFKSAHSLFELITKAFLLLAGVCYSVGIIVVNINLGQYGVYSLGLFRIGYIFAGIWTLILLLLVFLFIFLLKYSYKSVKIGGVFAKIFISVLVGGVFIGTIFMFIKAAHVGTIGTVGFTSIAFAAWIIIYSQSLFTKHIMQENRSRRENIDWSEVIPLALYIMAFFVMFLFGFARSIYCEIPCEIGGGHPMVVRIISTEDDLIYFSEVGITFTKKTFMSLADSTTNSSFVSEPLSVLLSTDKDDIFLISHKDSSYAVAIKNDLIKTLIYNRAKY
jgi:hypothetical protein